MWNTEKPADCTTFQGHSSSVYNISLSPDETRLVSGSEDKTIIVWNISDLSQEYSLNGHKGGVHSVRFSKDSKYIISGSSDKTIRI